VVTLSFGHRWVHVIKGGDRNREAGKKLGTRQREQQRASGPSKGGKFRNPEMGDAIYNIMRSSREAG